MEYFEIKNRRNAIQSRTNKGSSSAMNQNWNHAIWNRAVSGEEQQGNLKSAANKPQNRNRDIWKLYPNPAGEMLTIEFARDGADRIELHDISGRVVQTEKVSPKALQHVMNLSSLSPGYFVVSIVGSENRVLFHSSIVKQ